MGGDLRDRGPLEPALPVQVEGCPFQALERDVAGAAIAGPRVAGAQAALAYAERGVRTSIVRLALENTPGCWRRSRPDPRCSTTSTATTTSGRIVRARWCELRAPGGSVAP